MINRAINGIAYNYHWDLEYIKSSFNSDEVRDLLDDAILFNPMVSTKKEPEEVPQDIRNQMMENRKKWEKDDNSIDS